MNIQEEVQQLHLCCDPKEDQKREAPQGFGWLTSVAGHTQAGQGGPGVMSGRDGLENGEKIATSFSFVNGDREKLDQKSLYRSCPYETILYKK